MLRPLLPRCLILLIVCVVLMFAAETFGLMLPRNAMEFDVTNTHDNIILQVLDLSRHLRVNIGYINPLSRPVWSVDGRLAFVSDGDRQNGQIYIWDGDTLQNISETSNTDDTSPQWSVDGRLAFVSTPPDGDCEVKVWDDNRVLNISQSPDTCDQQALWSRSGQLVFIARSADSETIYIWDGAALDNIFQTSGQSVFTLAWTTDGTLEFWSRSVAVPDIYVWDGTGAPHVTRSQIASEHPSGLWMP